MKRKLSLVASALMGTGFAAAANMSAGPQTKVNFTDAIGSTKSLAISNGMAYTGGGSRVGTSNSQDLRTITDFNAEGHVVGAAPALIQAAGDLFTLTPRDTCASP